MRNQLYNKRYLKENRRALRKKGAMAEAILWPYLKNKQVLGRRFRRQFSVCNYILDFYCPSEKMAIELDGAFHLTAAGFEYDSKRTKYLNNQGIKVIRFENEEVMDDPEGVVAAIRKELNG